MKPQQMAVEAPQIPSEPLVAPSPAPSIPKAVETIGGPSKGVLPVDGARGDYYLIPVPHPSRPELPPYTAEVEDIIETLDMTFAEGNIFKALVRGAAARQGRCKEGIESPEYDAKKMVYFSQRNLVQVQAKLQRGEK